MAPTGPVTINGNAQLIGGLVADRLTVNGNGLLRLLAPPVTDELPFLANFEPAEGYQPGALDGQNGWAVTGAATVGTTLRQAGQQGVSVAPAASAALLVRAFANTDPGVTFVDLFALPAAAVTPEAGVFLDTDAARVALTGTGTTGTLHAFHGNGTGGGVWTSAGTGPALDSTGRSAAWLRLTTRTDYAAKKWDLYFDGRMVAADLGFVNDTPTAFRGLGLSGHTTQPTGFDSLLIAFDNPLFADADHDGLDDAWEATHRLNIALNDRALDPDADGLTNLQEYLLGTRPDAADTDSDGLSDPQEHALGTNPTNADSDADGLPDGWEKSHNLDPLLGTDAALDSDGDGVGNLAEFTAGTDPADFYNGVLPNLTSQVAADGALGPNGSLSIRVTNASDTPLVNAPVKCTATTGGHQLSATPDGPPATEVTVFSDAAGLVTVYVRRGGN